MIFLNDKKNFIIRSERNGYMNLYKVNLYTKEIVPLTDGQYDIDMVCHIDEKNNKIY